MFIATLIAVDTVPAGDISSIAFEMDVFGYGVTGWDWIDKGKAADIRFRSRPDDANGRPGGWFGTTTFASCPVDVVFQREATREKQLIVADMDSTMITVECIDELADYAGIKPEIAAITEAAMRGELDFEGALDARVALLAGLDEAVIERCLAERVRVMPGAKALVGTMRARGATAILVSGGFTRFAEPVAREIGFDRAIANVLEIEGGRLTGRVTKPIVGSDTKERALREAAAALGLDLSETLAVGDGANDLAMIRVAGLGVAYRAKPIVAAAAAARVDHGDLSVLLYAQGIARKDWVTS